MKESTDQGSPLCKNDIPAETCTELGRSVQVPRRESILDRENS